MEANDAQDNVVSKPFRIAELIPKIQELVASSAAKPSSTETMKPEEG